MDAGAGVYYICCSPVILTCGIPSSHTRKLSFKLSFLRNKPNISTLSAQVAVTLGFYK
jgi:hypothetical protein